jgi:ATP-dependent Clp protease ATP-binding subunit ClpC
MNFTTLKQHALKAYYPAFFLENIWPKAQGTFLVKFLRITWEGFIVAGLLMFGMSKTQVSHAEIYLPKIFGAFFLAFALWMIVAALHAFYNHFYYKSFSERERRKPLVSFELGRMLYQTDSRDLLQGFLKSDEGNQIMKRAGVPSDALADFIASRTFFIMGDALSFNPSGEYIAATEYSEALYDADKPFAQFLFAHGIQKKDLSAITEWVFEREVSRKIKARWWSREYLGRIPGIGKNWSYGQIRTLAQFAREIPTLDGDEYEVHDVYGSKELKALESILVRDRTANALIIGNNQQGSIHIVARLHRMMEAGTTMIVLQHKRLIMLDSDLISSRAKSKSDFETLVMTILHEAHTAGNVILVFEDFPVLLNTAEVLGADLASLLNPYLTSATLQIIALSDLDRFHKKIESNSALMNHFDKIIIENVDASNTIRVLENEVALLESKTKIFFTYPALRAVAESAERYFSEGVMPEQAVNLLFEAIAKLKAKNTYVVHKQDILDVIHIKTGIPMGDVAEEERDTLLNLESILHHRIIGQDEAVKVISNAVRRARSGINNPNRPLASFLFLGPTGVGKTETTKALGEVFFGKDMQMLRLDMSEYASADALSKLIGSFAAGKSGVLATILREHPYGVLLLDEFEKTTPEVMNLFLQVLDEGFFSDMDGKKINARNLLIIATSNAGSDLIWEAIKKGNNLDHSKDLIIESLITTHTFKPELLNRFDGVILFHPLGVDHLEKIARLQLEKLKARLRERGVNLLITDDLITYLMKYGVDPKFGARPMNRAIQDKIEQVIAEKMIRGQASSGLEMTLTLADLK